jgi:hypothetical protein
LLCTLVECDPTRRYAIDEFARFVEASPQKARREQVAKVKLPTHRKLSANGTDKFSQLVLASDTAPVGSRSEADFALCCWAVEHGMKRDDGWVAVAKVGKFSDDERYFGRTWDAAETHTREKILNAAQRVVGNHKSVKAADGVPSPKPEILLGTDEHRVNDKAIGYLAKDENVFQRGSTLCQIVRQRTIDDGIRRALGAPTIGALPENGCGLGARQRAGLRPGLGRRGRDPQRHAGRPRGRRPTAAHAPAPDGRQRLESRHHQ